MELPVAEVPQQGSEKQLNLRGSTVSLVESQDKKFKTQTDFSFWRTYLVIKSFRSSLKLLIIFLTSKLSQKYRCIISIRGMIFALPTCALQSHIKGEMQIFSVNPWLLRKYLPFTESLIFAAILLLIVMCKKYRCFSHAKRNPSSTLRLSRLQFQSSTTFHAVKINSGVCKG